MGSHQVTRPRSRRSRQIVAGGAALCIGLLPETTAPPAHAALADLFAPSVTDSQGNTRQASFLSGNILGPQLAIGLDNTSMNSTSANTATGLGNDSALIDTSGTVMVMLSCNGLTACANVGYGNTLQMNFLGSNIYNPQLAFGANNTSVNTTHSNFAERNGNNSIASTNGPAFVGGIFGRTPGNGNTMQINILSANIVNPQFSIGGNNTSTNSTNGNVARHNGNNSTASIATAGSALAGGTFGQIMGNGNSIQINILSNNIISTQFTLDGSNTSTDSAMGNVAENNGNHSFVSVSQHYDGTKIFGNGIFAVVTGNGNVVQIDILSNNVVNIQLAVHGHTNNTSHTNRSTNRTDVNVANGNGNSSATTVDSSSGQTVLVANTAVGNGNSQQTAFGGGNINNPQDNRGPGSLDLGAGQDSQGSRGRVSPVVDQGPDLPARTSRPARRDRSAETAPETLTAVSAPEPSSSTTDQTEATSQTAARAHDTAQARHAERRQSRSARDTGTAA